MAATLDPQLMLRNDYCAFFVMLITLAA